MAVWDIDNASHVTGGLLDRIDSMIILLVSLKNVTKPRFATKTECQVRKVSTVLDGG